MNSNIQKIVNKLVVQFGTNLSKLDKRRLDAYATVLDNMQATPALSEELAIYVVKQAQSLTSNTVECEMVLKYLLDNELIKICMTNKATVRLAISFEEFNQLVKYLNNKEIS
jgi:hypothetical protein